MRLAFLAGFLIATASSAAAGDARPYAGRPVAGVLDEFRDAGLPFAYSTGLVGAELRVRDEPVATDPYELVNEILAPHGLTLRTIAGVFLVVRADRTGSSAGTATEAVVATAGTIEMIVVSASRYEISRDIASSQFRLDRRSIQEMPDVGEDPVRITQRLPGAAASGASARTHFRGGNANEIGIMLNGQWLFDPYHVRDFQSVFSAIDARAVSGVEVYTGGFPVRYGDRMSGLVLMESMDLEEPRHTELGISVFNTSLLTTGRSGDRRWLFSARRGNLDLVIDSQFGRPSYYDVFGEIAVDMTTATTFSVNALFADDSVRVVTESDPDELEQVVSDTRNAQFWLNLGTEWSDSLSSRTVLSVTAYENLRIGSAGDEEKMVADVRDERSVDQFALRQEWTWTPSDRHRLQWGLQGAYGDADYDYDGSAEYFGLPAMYEGQPPDVQRTATATPAGGSFALFVSDRWRLTPKTIVEWGLRWDDQAYTGPGSDAQVSPRINLLHALNERTEFRFTWGRYSQSQGIHELQIEDGVTSFWPAERSDHAIVGMRRLLAGDVSLRVEAFYKSMSLVRPRYENLYDPLAVIPELQPDRVELRPQSAESGGLEVSIDRSSGPWNWWWAYTLSRATDRIDGRDEPRSWDQRHALQGGITWSTDDWTVAFAGSVHTGWPATNLELVQTGTDPDGEPVYKAVPGPRNALGHPTFASLDFRISRNFDVKRGSLTAFVEVSNLTNRRNVCCLDWDVADDGDGNLELELSRDYWLPLLPAIGILWEF